MNKIEGERQYFKYWRDFLDDPYKKNISISSSRFPGKYCIEFRNFKAADFFNSIETNKKLMDCEYYAPSIIIKKERDWDILELEDTDFYNCYPKYYGSSEMSVCMGKNFIINSKPNFPFLIQDRIQPNSESGIESIYILYVKKDNSISSYYSPIEIENKRELFEALLNVQEYIIPKIDSKNYSDIEYLLTEFDIVEDENNKFWLKGINCDPILNQNNLEKIVEDIFHHMNTCEFNYFLDLSLEKLVQTHCSSFSL